MSPQEIVEKFNSLFPVGAKVPWRSIQKGSMPYRDYTVSSSAVVFEGRAIVWFAEKTGRAFVEPGFVDYKAVEVDA